MVHRQQRPGWPEGDIDRGEGSAGLGRIFVSGTVYFVVVFALGFLLGTARELLLVREGIDRLVAVGVEVPIMLGASWFACRAVVRRWRVPAVAGDRLAMGALAFALLIAAETVVGVFLLGRTPAEQAASYWAADAALGLAAQLLFAAFPWLQGRYGR